MFSVRKNLDQKSVFVTLKRRHGSLSMGNNVPTRPRLLFGELDEN